ncbi:MAG: RDD family protein [Anaerolineaceae bacterium]
METTHRYGGFWRRAAAALIDILILGIFITLVTIVLGKAWQASFGDSYESESGMYWLLLLAPVVITWVYAIGFESDEGATLGKQALGIKVCCMDGGQPGIMRLSARWLLHALSAVILGIGFLMPLWTKKKQTLHDILTGTLVVRKAPTE